ncbi:MAG: PAS domain S-box protein, partial [Burkholderiales bacterium 21-58-4]
MGESCIIMVIQDITELRKAIETVKEQNAFLNAIFDSEPHCVKVVALDGNLIQMNRAGLAMLEIESLESVREHGLLEFIAPQYRKLFTEFHRSICSGRSGKLEFPVTGAKGTNRWLETHATPLRDAGGRIVALLGVTRDITEKKQRDALIWKQANYDLLTELPNRYMLHDRLEQEIKRAHLDEEMLAVFFIDLDRFKEVNDTLGHQSGDILLMDAAERITGCVRASDTVARLGGDEFTVILSQHDMNHVEKIAQDILDRLAEPFLIGDDRIYVSASIGITLYPSDAGDVEQLLKNADQAMYAAKNAGRNRFSYFTSSLQEMAQSRLRLLKDLRKCLEENQFRLHFQPIVELSTGRIVKAEALLRWDHPERGMISPMEFIPLAEETGLILPIGDWVFREAVKWATLWTRKYPHLMVGVNMSPLQFQNAEKNIETWLDHIQKQGVSGRNIVIEITEGLLLDADVTVTEKL